MSPATFQESGVTIDLTGRPHFQFSTCAGYRALSGHGLKEMDIGWLETGLNGQPNKLYVVELKDFGLDTLTGRKGHLYPSYAAKAAFIIEELFSKSLDMLLLLAAVVVPTSYAPQLAPCLPMGYQPGSPVQLIHVLHFSPSLVPYLSDINTKVKIGLLPTRSC